MSPQQESSGADQFLPQLEQGIEEERELSGVLRPCIEVGEDPTLTAEICAGSVGDPCGSSHGASLHGVHPVYDAGAGTEPR
jgi:hypothetical protein